VGFPTETEQDFAETMQLVHDIGFDNSFSFIYSARPGTPAANLVDRTSDEEKHKRLHYLQAAIARNAKRISERMVGTVQTVVVEGPSENSTREMTERQDNMRFVNFPGDPRMVGQFVDVVITEAMSNSLRGRVHQSEAVPA